jgi:serine/threonine-protein phosphatase 5
MMGSPEEGTKLKDQGNNAFRNQEWDKALEFYTKAIEAHNADPSFYTNRAQVGCPPYAHAHDQLLNQPADIHQA